MPPQFKLAIPKKVVESRGLGPGSGSNERGRCAVGTQNPLKIIVNALPIS